MTWLRLGALLSLLLSLSANIAEASQSSRLIQAGQLRIDGKFVSCGRVPVLISDHYPDFGAAKRGLIILNPARMSKLPKAARLVIYYHECAHQYVGRSELAADCWAVQKTRREGLLNRAGLMEACAFVKNLPANRHHPPGTERCRHMTQCFDNTVRVKADNDSSGPASLEETSDQSRGFSRPGKMLSVFPDESKLP